MPLCIVMFKKANLITSDHRPATDDGRPHYVARDRSFTREYKSRCGSRFLDSYVAHGDFLADFHPLAPVSYTGITSVFVFPVLSNTNSIINKVYPLLF